MSSTSRLTGIRPSFLAWISPLCDHPRMVLVGIRIPSLARWSRYSDAVIQPVALLSRARSLSATSWRCTREPHAEHLPIGAPSSAHTTPCAQCGHAPIACRGAGGLSMRRIFSSKSASSSSQPAALISNSRRSTWRRISLHRNGTSSSVRGSARNPAAIAAIRSSCSV